MSTKALLMAIPSLTAEFLLGEGLSSNQALVVARVAGVALVSISVSCWLARNADRRAQSGQVVGVLVYNLAVPLLLIYGWFAAGCEGPGLWPASVLHALLALWCVVCLLPFRDDRTL